MSESVNRLLVDSQCQLDGHAPSRPVSPQVCPLPGGCGRSCSRSFRPYKDTPKQTTSEPVTTKPAPVQDVWLDLKLGSSPLTEQVVGQLDLSTAVATQGRTHLSRALHCWLQNMVRWVALNKQNAGGGGLCFSSKSNAYIGKSLGINGIKRASKYLQTVGLLSESSKAQAIYDIKIKAKGFRGTASVLTPTPLFISMLEDFERAEQGAVASTITAPNLPRYDVILVRSGKDPTEETPVRTILNVNPDLPIVKAMASQLVELNTLNLAQRWELDFSHLPARKTLPKFVGELVAERKIAVNPGLLIYMRTFSGGVAADPDAYGFDLGGRFNSGIIRSPGRLDRRYLCVNGEPLAEADFKSMHVMLAYALKSDYISGKSMYKIPGTGPHERTIVKVLTLALLNKAKGRTGIFGLVNDKKRKRPSGKYTEGAWRKYRTRKAKELRNHRALGDKAKALSEAFDVGPDGELISKLPKFLCSGRINRIVDAILGKHKTIAEFMFSSFGIRAQNLESRIAEYVVARAIEHRVPILIYHDGFMVPESKVYDLRDWMLEGFQKVTGVSIRGADIEVSRYNHPGRC